MKINDIKIGQRVRVPATEKMGGVTIMQRSMI